MNSGIILGEIGPDSKSYETDNEAFGQSSFMAEQSGRMFFGKRSANAEYAKSDVFSLGYRIISSGYTSISLKVFSQSL